jgi:hypothetical protein
MGSVTAGETAQKQGDDVTPKELETIGKKLYGAMWRSKLAKAVTRSPGAVTHWMSGKSRIPSTVVVAVRDLAESQDSKEAE